MTTLTQKDLILTELIDLISLTLEKERSISAGFLRTFKVYIKLTYH
jgi:hypothetical protein